MKAMIRIIRAYFYCLWWLNQEKTSFKYWWNSFIGWARPYLTWKMLPFLLIAWFITNGWAYVFIAIGTPTMRKIALSYIAFLWLPISPEKIVTIPLAFFIQKLLFKSKK
jgi:hypothetical protein